MSNNLPLNKAQTGDTAAFFSGYYVKNIPVSGQQYDAVIAFFLKRTGGDRVAAESLAASVLWICNNRGLDPISIILDFKQIESDEAFKAALIALINSDRRNTSKLGFAVTPTPNETITRNIGK